MLTSENSYGRLKLEKKFLIRSGCNKNKGFKLIEYAQKHITYPDDYDM